MIKVLENNLQNSQVKNIEKSIEAVINRLKTIRENLQFSSEKYDLDILFDILCHIFDDIGDFSITLDGDPIQ